MSEEQSLDLSYRYGKFIGARSLAFLIGELDDSGTHGKSNTVVAGAMVSDIDDWPKIEQAWMSVLAEYDVKKFHYADFDSSWGEFKGWSPGQKTEFMIRLIKIVNSQECTAFAYGNYNQVFDEAIRAFPQENGFDLYSLCVEMCIGYAIGYFKPEESGVNMLITIPHKPRYRGDLLPYWQGRSPRLGVRTSSDSHTVQHQIADLIAREYYKYVDKIPENLKSHGTNVQSLLIFRKSFNALLEKYMSAFVSVDADLERILDKRSRILTNG